MKYFDLNYQLGRGTLNNGDYDTVEAILEQMDYLGIDRSLVWSAEARDWSAVNGNRELLEIIEPFSKRLFPCFVITPRDYYEKGTVDFYQQQCASGRVRAFRISPVSGRSPVRECEFVLQKLAEYKPLVLIDTRELNLTDYADLELLARSLPTVKFVLNQKIWCDLDVVFNLMKRCENILLDTSWLHVRNTIESAIGLFGADRLLFATGHKNQYGAAIGALAHAEISDADREKIAHGNAEALLDLMPSDIEITTPEILQRKPLWCSFARGEMPTDIKIIDAHTHQGGPALNGYLLPDSDAEAALPEMIRVMDKFNIAQSIVIGSRALCGNCLKGNRELAEQTLPYRDRLHGYWVFNPHQCADISEEVLAEEFADGFFAGFKIFSGYWKIQHDDKRFKTMWEFAEKRSLPVLLHTWNDIEPLENVVPRYKHVKFILAHSGGGNSGRLEAVKLALKYKNVFLDSCGTFCATLPLADAVKTLGADRFIFGSDAAYHNTAYELAALLSMPLEDDLLRPILCKTIRDLVNI